MCGRPGERERKGEGRHRTGGPESVLYICPVLPLHFLFSRSQKSGVQTSPRWREGEGVKGIGATILTTKFLTKGSLTAPSFRRYCL